MQEPRGDTLVPMGLLDRLSDMIVDHLIERADHDATFLPRRNQSSQSWMSNWTCANSRDRDSGALDGRRFSSPSMPRAYSTSTTRQSVRIWRRASPVTNARLRMT